MITVMGATGQVGGGIVQRLLKSGESVRALGRSLNKLAALQAAGADVLAGDARDATFLARVFQGADSAYIMLPFDPYLPGYDAEQDGISAALVTAIRSAGTRHIVCLSSVGADQPSGTGFIATLNRHEQRLRALLDVNVLILRPGYFFENFYANLYQVWNQGMVSDCVAPDIRIPMIATRDIAVVAEKALTARDWQGVVVRELLGPRDLCFNEVTRILGAQIGKPDLPYVQCSYTETVASLIQLGFAEDYAALHAETMRALSEGRVRSRETRAASNTTSTRFEEFAADLARAYREAKHDG